MGRIYLHVGVLDEAEVQFDREQLHGRYVHVRLLLQKVTSATGAHSVPLLVALRTSLRAPFGSGTVTSRIEAMPTAKISSVNGIKSLAWNKRRLRYLITGGRKVRREGKPIGLHLQDYKNERGPLILHVHKPRHCPNGSKQKEQSFR